MFFCVYVCVCVWFYSGPESKWRAIPWIMSCPLLFTSPPVRSSLPSPHLVLWVRDSDIELNIRDFRLPPRSRWRLALCRHFTQRIVAIRYRTFRTIYWSDPQGSRNPRFGLNCRHTVRNIPEERRSKIKYNLSHKIPPWRNSVFAQSLVTRLLWISRHRIFNFSH